MRRAGAGVDRTGEAAARVPPPPERRPDTLERSADDPELEPLLRGIEAALAMRRAGPIPGAAPASYLTRPRARTIAALAGALAMLALGIAAFWWLGSAPNELGPGRVAQNVELSAQVVGTYRGDVIADAKGGSRSDVTVTISRIDARTVDVRSDYARLGSRTVELSRVGNTIQSATPDTLLLLETAHEPPQLSFNPGGEVVFKGDRQ